MPMRWAVNIVSERSFLSIVTKYGKRLLSGVQLRAPEDASTWLGAEDGANGDAYYPYAGRIIAGGRQRLPKPDNG